MSSLEGLKRKIDSTHDLQSVVKTMKAMAAANIRHFEKAVEALKTYNETVETAFQVALWNRTGVSITSRTASERGDIGAVVFGTDQGMCGAINETVVFHALETLGGLNANGAPVHLVVVGLRAESRLMDEGRAVERLFDVPGSVEAVTPLVRNLVVEIENRRERHPMSRVLLFHCAPESGGTYSPRDVRLLPLDRQWLDGIREKPWPNRRMPLFTMEWDALFSALVREYLFVSLYRAAAESLAAENASRLAAMQGAESNIEEQLDELQGEYHRERQKGITEELQDIASGFEALRS